MKVEFSEKSESIVMLGSTKIYCNYKVVFRK